MDVGEYDMTDNNAATTLGKIPSLAAHDDISVDETSQSNKHKRLIDINIYDKSATHQEDSNYIGNPLQSERKEAH